MVRLAHVSDLHFGTECPPVLAALGESLREWAPELVVVTGDLTQRARPRQFEAARQFLLSLTCPYLVVPGNHDIAPVWRPFQRIFHPFERYRRAIAQDINTIWHHEELLVLGVSSVRPWRWKAGLLSAHELAWIRTHAERPPNTLCLLATHHPIIHRGKRAKAIANVASWAMLDAADISACLSGHLHVGFNGLIRDPFEARRSVLAIHACTAVSTRLRGHPNAYNQITVSGQRVLIKAITWDGDGFVRNEEVGYERHQGEWHTLPR